MEQLLKETLEFRCDTEELAQKLIQRFKDNAAAEGYELASYSSTLKEKKSKGEIIDSWAVVKIIKKYSVC